MAWNESVETNPYAKFIISFNLCFRCYCIIPLHIIRGWKSTIIQYSTFYLFLQHDNNNQKIGKYLNLRCKGTKSLTERTRVTELKTVNGRDMVKFPMSQL